MSQDWLKKSFGAIYSSHIKAFAELVITLRRDFKGDLDSMLILAVIGDRRLSRALSPDALTYQTIGHTKVVSAEKNVINTLSIAEYTGIPRETVRRKVATLITRGWVAHDQNGDLIPTKKAATDLATSTDATLRYLETVVSACDMARAKVNQKQTGKRRGSRDN